MEDYPGQAYFHQHNPRIARAENNWKTSDAFIFLNTPYEHYCFPDRPVAKSSTSVCMATVCPKCGHRFDGKIGGAGEPCDCKCHEGRT